MTELTRLFDMIRDADARFRLERAWRDGSWEWWGCLHTFREGWGWGWQTFQARQPTPEAVVADLVLQLAEWQSK